MRRGTSLLTCCTLAWLASTDAAAADCPTEGAAPAAPAAAQAAAQGPPGSGCIDPEIAGYVETRGGRLWYRMNGAQHLGTGVPALLALHGGPGSSHRALLSLVGLADRYPVVLYDQLDSGNSDRPGNPGNWTVEQFVQEIETVRSALHLDDVVILGHSAGGAWATVYAGQHPPSLRGLILAGPLVSTRLWLDDVAKLRAQLPDVVREELDRHEAAGTTGSESYLRAVEAFYARHLCHGPCPNPCFAQGRPAFNEVLYEHMWGPNEFTATGVLREFDALPLLRNVESPLLVICGEYDEVRQETCARLAAMAGHGTTAAIAGAAHMAPLENPTEFVTAVRRFLDSLQGDQRE